MKAQSKPLSLPLLVEKPQSHAEELIVLAALVVAIRKAESRLKPSVARPSPFVFVVCVSITTVVLASPPWWRV